MYFFAFTSSCDVLPSLMVRHRFMSNQPILLHHHPKCMSRHNTADPVSELFESVGHSLKKKDLSLLIVIGIVGCIGSMSIFKKSFLSRASSPKNLSTIKIVEDAASLTPTLQNIDPHLNISGSFHTAENVNFEIANHNPKVLYEVRFGDGKHLKGKLPAIVHKYPKAGTYNVELIMFYKDKSKSVYNTSVTIFPLAPTFSSSL